MVKIYISIGIWIYQDLSIYIYIYIYLCMRRASPTIVGTALTLTPPFWDSPTDFGGAISMASWVGVDIVSDSDLEMTG